MTEFFVALSEALPVLKKMRFEPFDAFRRDPDEVLRCRVQRHSLPKHFRVVKGTMNQNLTKKLFLSTVNMLKVYVIYFVRHSLVYPILLLQECVGVYRTAAPVSQLQKQVEGYFLKVASIAAVSSMSLGFDDLFVPLALSTIHLNM